MKVVPKRIVSDAVHYRGDNVEEIKDWINGFGEQIPVNYCGDIITGKAPEHCTPNYNIMLLASIRNWTVASVGDWIVRGPDGLLTTMTTEAFDNYYENETIYRAALEVTN